MNLSLATLSLVWGQPDPVAAAAVAISTPAVGAVEAYNATVAASGTVSGATVSKVVTQYQDASGAWVDHQTDLSVGGGAWSVSGAIPQAQAFRAQAKTSGDAVVVTSAEQALYVHVMLRGDGTTPVFRSDGVTPIFLSIP